MSKEKVTISFDLARNMLIAAIEANMDYFNSIGVDDYAKWSSLVNQVASRLRRGNVPLDYIFLKNVERNKDGILYRGGLDCLIVDTAFDDSGRILPRNIAIYERLTEDICPDIKYIEELKNLTDLSDSICNESYNANMSKLIAPKGYRFMSNYPNVEAFISPFQNTDMFAILENAYDDRCNLIPETVAIYVKIPE